MDAFTMNRESDLSNKEFFSAAMNELFEDLRQSDAFRVFLENDTFSTANIGDADKSDPTLMVTETQL
jgi:hypothetical protein